MIRNMGLDVDDDNAPAPENVPVPGISVGTETKEEVLDWGWDGIDPRKRDHQYDARASIVGLSEMAMQGLCPLRMFLLFLLKYFIENVILAETNKSLGEDGMPITYGEFLRWIGILLFMSTLSGFKRRDYWSLTPINLYSGAPYRLNDWMSLRRYEEITNNLTYTKNDPPLYRDRFWEVRDLL
jgi:hypothetical protein